MLQPRIPPVEVVAKIIALLCVQSELEQRFLEVWEHTKARYEARERFMFDTQTVSRVKLMNYAGMYLAGVCNGHPSNHVLENGAVTAMRWAVWIRQVCRDYPSLRHCRRLR